ncbi:MAG: hypothetical protein ACEPOV_14370 [Hyphomicrobiales bacterium]
MIILKQIWEDLSSNYCADNNLVNELWEEIEQLYSSLSRFYHTLEHIEYMAEMALENKELISNMDAFLFSIFYHDIIYNAKRTDNEDKSAILASKHLSKLNVPEEIISKCQEYIIATKRHKACSCSDTNMFLDMDLAILGESQLVYNRYSLFIRQEYSCYSDIQYNCRRIILLQRLLSRKRIFKTDLFFNLYEQQARNNINKEITFLENSIKK